jgi:hypothetical protein
MSDATDEVLIPADRGRWDGEIVASRDRTLRWGTTEIVVRLHEFGDGDTHAQVLVPSERPLWAVDMVADLQSDDGPASAIGEVCARVWDVTPDELHAHGEVSA